MKWLCDVGITHMFQDVEGIQKHWGRFLTLGILLIVLGMLAMSSAVAVTIFSVALFGIFLMGAGVMQIIHGILARKWKGLLLSILLGIFYLVAGGLCTFQPTLSAESLTLFIGTFCIFVGVFRMLITLFVHFERAGWVFFNGLVTSILGVLILANWPLSGLWIIGFFIGIDMILSGWSWILLALVAKNSSK